MVFFLLMFELEKSALHSPTSMLVFQSPEKIYHYKIYNDTVLDPFHRLYAYHNLSKLNVSVMKEAAKYFVGQHDFSSFANKQRNDRVVNPVKNISRVDIIEKGPILQVEVEGSGFLYRQVRNMVHSTYNNLKMILGFKFYV
ncbi:unnamed protein product [Lactuca saligna]|uniref:tRNA pseudouridine synthase n=1 Tax=Lactuca saligna TaxID=75948 RepID=A0AA35UZP7_LACSI|nr:unnamed protein product [Lactuca saligna]